MPILRVVQASDYLLEHVGLQGAMTDRHSSGVLHHLDLDAVAHDLALDAGMKGARAAHSGEAREHRLFATRTRGDVGSERLAALGADGEAASHRVLAALDAGGVGDLREGQSAASTDLPGA
jgi:hypothetical protein